MTTTMTGETISLGRHVPDGELYILRWRSDIDEFGLDNGEYTACAGPLYQPDWADEETADGVRPDWLERAEDYLANQDEAALAENAAWANTRRWTHVIGQEPNE